MVLFNAASCTKAIADWKFVDAKTASIAMLLFRQ
jgi:hypothetical protein